MAAGMTAEQKTIADLEHAVFHDEHGVKPRMAHVENRVKSIEDIMKEERDNRSKMNWLIVANLLTVAGIIFKVWWGG